MKQSAPVGVEGAGLRWCLCDLVNYSALAGVSMKQLTPAASSCKDIKKESVASGRLETERDVK